MNPNEYFRHLNLVVSVAIILFLSYMIMNHLFKKFFRRSIRVEGFDSASETELPSSETELPSSETELSSGETELSSSETELPSSETKLSDNRVTEDTTESDTDKSTLMVELFENVNKQMDMIRTLKLGDKIIPINIDKTPSENVLVLANLKLLINNGVYKNELDLKEVYDKYIGNKAIQLLTSDINSLNLEKPPDNISTLETKFLTRCKSVVDAHQKILNKIFDNKSKE
jgi:hypothetical protein